MNKFLSMDGRINRARYLGRALAIMAVTFLTSFISGFSLGIALGADAQQAAAVVGALIGLAATVLLAFQAVKRLHDLGRPGAHYWLLLVPFYNLYLAILMLFARGTTGPNRFGEDPLTAKPIAIPATI